jgi:hypothetical protein
MFAIERILSMSVVTISNSNNKVIKIVGCDFFKKEEDDDIIIITLSPSDNRDKKENQAIEQEEAAQEPEPQIETSLKTFNNSIKSDGENTAQEPDETLEDAKKPEASSKELWHAWGDGNYTIRTAIGENRTQQIRKLAAKYCKTKPRFISIGYASDTNSDLSIVPPELYWTANRRRGCTRVVLVNKTVLQMERRPSSLILHIVKAEDLYLHKNQKTASVHGLNGDLFYKNAPLKDNRLFISSEGLNNQ